MAISIATLCNLSLDSEKWGISDADTALPHGGRCSFGSAIWSSGDHTVDFDLNTLDQCLAHAHAQAHAQRSPRPAHTSMYPSVPSIALTPSRSAIRGTAFPGASTLTAGEDGVLVSSPISAPRGERERVSTPGSGSSSGSRRRRNRSDSESSSGGRVSDKDSGSRNSGNSSHALSSLLSPSDYAYPYTHTPDKCPTAALTTESIASIAPTAPAPPLLPPTLVSSPPKEMFQLRRKV